LCEDFGRANRKEEVLEGVMKYWLHLLGTDETNLFADTMGQQRKERGNTGTNRTKQKLLRLGPEQQQSG
jgi:uncharacterized protein (DUF1697 family)